MNICIFCVEYTSGQRSYEMMVGEGLHWFESLRSLARALQKYVVERRVDVIELPIYRKFTIDFKPPHDIVCDGGGPHFRRCFPLTQDDTEFFWQYFSN